ncbi:hypothetical protein [Paenisporosarcina cavernae]|nr:hypothetical protein [Paenisporosarcina cavernae]
MKRVSFFGRKIAQGKLNKLSEKEKRRLKIKDGQHEHHVDERGGN